MDLSVWHTDCAYLLPHFDKEKLSGKVESDVCVISIIPNVRNGDVQRDVLHSSQSQIRSPVINTAGKEQQINTWLFILLFLEILQWKKTAWNVSQRKSSFTRWQMETKEGRAGSPPRLSLWTKPKVLFQDILQIRDFILFTFSSLLVWFFTEMNEDRIEESLLFSKNTECHQNNGVYKIFGISWGRKQRLSILWPLHFNVL